VRAKIVGDAAGAPVVSVAVNADGAARADHRRRQRGKESGRCGVALSGMSELLIKAPGVLNPLMNDE